MLRKASVVGGSLDKSKSQEKLVVTTGSVVCIDQFMLANKQYLELVAQQGSPAEAAKRYGGAIFDFPEGEYLVFRDPKLQIVAIAKDADSACVEEDEGLGGVIESFGPSAHSDSVVRIDTRCLVIADSSILSNQDLIAEFSSLREAEKEKEARDLLRKEGAAVRYGFNKWGDELSLFSRTEPQALAALWPE